MTTRARTVSIMRAIRAVTFGAPEVMQLQSEVPIPEPGEKEVLIKSHAIGVNPVDTYIRTGTHALKPSLPYTPGCDAAGIVDKVGSKVTKFKPGDRAFVFDSSSGTYAEYFTSKETDAYLLPAQMNFKEGAALGVPYFTAYRALIEKCRIKPGRTVLVHGASGGTGIACVQIARAYGLTVLGTAGSPTGLDLVTNAGAHHVFNHREEGYEQKIMECTGGKGVDFIIEMLSNINLAKDLTLINKFGTIAVIGCRGPIEINPRLMMGKESSVVGVMLRNATQEEYDESYSAIRAGIEAGWVKPVIAKEYPLQDAAQAHIDIINTKAAQGRLLLMP